MAQKKEVKMKDLKPSKDAKGGAARMNQNKMSQNQTRMNQNQSRSSMNKSRGGAAQ